MGFGRYQEAMHASIESIKYARCSGIILKSQEGFFIMTVMRFPKFGVRTKIEIEKK